MFGAFLAREWVFLIAKEQELKFKSWEEPGDNLWENAIPFHFIEVAELPLVLSSKGFNLLYHPDGTHISMELQLNWNIQVWVEMWTILDYLKSTSEVLLGLCHFIHFQKQYEEEEREGKSSMESINFSLCCLFQVSPEIFGFMIFHSNFHVIVQAHMLLPTFMSLHILVTSPAVCMYICMFAYNYQFEDLTGKALPGRLTRVTPPILNMYLLYSKYSFLIIIFKILF